MIGVAGTLLCLFGIDDSFYDAASINGGEHRQYGGSDIGLLPIWRGKEGNLAAWGLGHS